MPREFARNQRVASQIRRELASIIQTDLKDPRLGFMTVSEVALTRDLSVAKVYFTILGKGHEQVENNRNIIDQSIPFIRRQLGKRMRMRVLPELRFIHDTSIEKGIRIEELLNPQKIDSAQNEGETE